MTFSDGGPLSVERMMYNKTWGSETHHSLRESVYPGTTYHKAGET